MQGAKSDKLVPEGVEGRVPYKGSMVNIPNGNIRYQLKTPYRESLPRERSECFEHATTHVNFEPLDFIARLAALAPRRSSTVASTPRDDFFYGSGKAALTAAAAVREIPVDQRG